VPKLPDDVRALLDASNFAHVATVGADGSADVVPVWVATDGDRVVFFTQTTSRKARNLGRDPRVAISVVDHMNPYRSLQLRGRVVEQRTDEAIWRTIDPMAERYTGEPFPFRPETTVLCFVEVDSARVRELPFEHRGRT
jgi:PPOX class probable F420-dependent enzyme